MDNATLSTVIVEWAPFRLREGVDEETLLECSERLQEEFLRGQPGFIRRELLRRDDREWVDLVYWADEQSAHDVMPAVADSPACRAYFDLMIGADIAEPGGGVTHFRRLRSYDP